MEAFFTPSCGGSRTSRRLSFEGDAGVLVLSYMHGTARYIPIHVHARCMRWCATCKHSSPNTPMQWSASIQYCKCDHAMHQAHLSPSPPHARPLSPPPSSRPLKRREPSMDHATTPPDEMALISLCLKSAELARLLSLMQYPVISVH